MIYKTVKLCSVNSHVLKTKGGELNCYIRENIKQDEEFLRPAVIIVPGGAYINIAKRASEPVALKFLSLGYNAFVLNYTVMESHYPQQVTELAASIAYIREHSEELSINPDKICLLGFSAGGHLCANLTNDYKNISALINENPEKIKADICALAYPVISSGKYSHSESFENLCGKNNESTIEKLSVEKIVNSETCPTFIWTTAEDELVPCQNSLLYAKALADNNIPFELHVFEKGKHALALCEKEYEDDPYISADNKVWVELCDRFFQRFFNKAKTK